MLQGLNSAPCFPFLHWIYIDENTLTILYTQFIFLFLWSLRDGHFEEKENKGFVLLGFEL